jgi:hypothetical protein
MTADHRNLLVEAEKKMQAALQHNPLNVDLLHRLGYLNLILGKPGRFHEKDTERLEKACRILQETCRRDMGDHRPAFRLGEACSYLDDWEEAHTWFREAENRRETFRFVSDSPELE